MMADPTLPGKKPSRLWRAVLVISLALNLAVAGIVIGAVVSGRTGEGGPRSFDLGVGPMARALAPNERRQITRSLRDSRALRDLNPRGRVDRMVAVIVADPFDPAALQTLMAEQSAKVDVMQAQAQSAFLQTITDMTPERRAAFAAALSEELSRPRSPRPRGTDD